MTNQGHPHAEHMMLYAEDAMRRPDPWVNWQYSMCTGIWIECECSPRWDPDQEYRRVPAGKPSINWDDVDPRLKYMATDASGTWLFEIKPTLKFSDVGEVDWVRNAADADGNLIELVSPNCISTTPFASFKDGNCRYEDSLVKRPS